MMCLDSLAEDNYLSATFLNLKWKRVDGFSTYDVTGTKFRVSMTMDCLQARFVGKLWPWGQLFCRKMVDNLSCSPPCYSYQV